MARSSKKNAEKKTTTEHAPVERGAATSVTESPLTKILVLVIILVTTVVTYLPVFDETKEFTNWDDTGYVTEQPLVRSLDKANIAKMFDTDTRVAANYHPLTMLSLAIDYDRGQGSIQPFMQTNLVLHLLNTALVFGFILMLFPGNLVMATLVSALFGVHPMHVESVAWVAERKDVLYTAFFMLSLISYVRYAKGGSWAWLVGAFAAFVASCYAKPMAVTLPVVLVLLDVFEKRTFSIRSAVEKVPFFVVSVIFGLLTLSVQSSTGAGLVDTTYYTLFERILFALYGVVAYTIKLFVPINLSAFYPYPATGGNPESVVYVYAGLASLIIGGIVWMYWKKRSELSSTLFFGMGFFLVTISIVLQLISVGGAVIADRYTYVPYLGLFIIIGVLIERFAASVKAPYAGLGIAAVASVVLSMTSMARIAVWQNSGVLWDDVIKQYGSRSISHAYNNRAVYNMNKKNFVQAESDYAYLERIGTSKSYTYKGYGALLQMMKRPAEAIPRFTKALHLGGDDIQVIRARAACYAQLKRHDSAIADLSRARSLAPSDLDIAMLLLDECLGANRFQDVLTYGASMAAIASKNPQYFMLMGVANGQLGNHAAAYKAFASALELDPKNGQAKANMEIARKFL
jgi:Flp pilus assembly protein TadD